MQKIFWYSFPIIVGLAIGYVFVVGAQTILVAAEPITDPVQEKISVAGEETSGSIRNFGRSFRNFTQNLWPFSNAAEENDRALVLNDDKISRSLPVRIGDKIAQREIVLPDDSKSIVADLDQMRLFLYDKGVATGEYDLLSKGRPGSPWETPPGDYEILYKKENHFSSIGKVWMPYSMQFFGNYFIHGWPHYSDGTPVDEGYSGGCIRLANDEMKEVYDFADISTPVFVINDGQVLSNDSHYTVRQNAQPSISARAYLIADIESGDILARKNEKENRAIASVTKLMTALVSLEVVNQFQETEISQSAMNTHGYQGNLTAGEIIEIKELIYPLLLTSSNDASEAIAEHYGRKRFVSYLNDKADAIGLLETSFDDPSGLSWQNRSTAEDLFRLAQYIYKFKRYIFDVTRMEKYENDDHIWRNNSRFVKNAAYVGGKNGYTSEAGKTQVALFDIDFGDEERTIAIILLKSGDVSSDVSSALRFVRNNVDYISQ